VAGFFLSVFRGPWSVVVRPWSVVEAIVAPFSCTSHAGTRASVQSGRDPWAFGRGFHVVTRSAAFGSRKLGRCRNNYTPAVVWWRRCLYLDKQTRPAGRGAWPVDKNACCKLPGWGQKIKRVAGSAVAVDMWIRPAARCG